MTTAHSRRGSPGRIKAVPARELVGAGFALEVEDAHQLHGPLALSHIVHVLELRDAGVVTPADSERIHGALVQLALSDAAELPYEPGGGDAFDVQETWLIDRLGPGAEWLTAGRARREALRVAYRLLLRERLLDASQATADVVAALVDRAEQLVDAVCPDYSYLQPAQVTTFGHYLLSFAAPHLRHLERFRGAYKLVNRSPTGVGPVAGSRFAFDRTRSARRLGFDGVVAHARDAMWQADQLVDAATAAALALSTSSQLAQDLEIYSSAEFGFVALPDSVCRPSAVMPQKRNPYGLAVVRGLAGRASGLLAGILSMQRTGSARTDNVIFSFSDALRCVDWAARGQALVAVTIHGLEVDRARLEQAARRPDLRATDLAEQIVEELAVDYGTAYRAAAKTIALADDADGDSPGFAELAASALADELGSGHPGALGVLAHEPEELLSARTGVGSPSPESMAAMLDADRRELREHREWVDGERSRLCGFEQSLLDPTSR